MSTDCSQIKSALTHLLDLRNQFAEAYSRVDESLGRHDPANQQAMESSETKMKEIKEAIQELENLLPISLEQAQEIMEADGYHGFLGPEAIKQAFGMELSSKEIPPINFTKEQLERAKDLGQFLVLRLDRIKDNQGEFQPLNVANLVEISSGRNIKLRNQDDWLATTQGPREKGVVAIKDQTPQPGWSLVSSELVPGTKNKNYLEQTEIIIDYLKSKIYPGQELFQPYEEALKEFEQIKKARPNLAELTVSQEESEWKLAAKILGNLKITKLLRRTPIEILYDLYVFKDRYGKYLLSGPNYDWSSGRHFDDRLAFLGSFDSRGVDTRDGMPGYSYGIPGVSVSRRSFPA